MFKNPIRISLKELFSLFILFLISLAPFFWLRGGYVILGHDSGLPLSPTPHFLDRLQTWTSRYNAGDDQTFALGGFFIHGLEALIDLTGLPLSIQQSIQFSFYIFLIGLSMYLFCKTTWGREAELIAVIASVFYQINHFVLQGWFIAERTKFSLYIALPLLLLLFYKLFTSKTSPIKIGVLSALVLFVFNGGGFLPLFAGIFISMLVWTLVYFRKTNNFKTSFGRFSIYLITFLLCSLILQLYWIFPYANYVKNNFQLEVSQAGGTAGVINWVQSISQNTSYLNLLKLQGIQEWYVNSEHPYAKVYFTNFFLKFFPYLFILVLFFNAVKVNKEKRTLQLACVGTVLIAVFFMSGSHKPFGDIYIWMIKNIPGFIAFRTPYYKFAPAFFVSFAPLLGFTVSELFKLRFFRATPYLLKVIVPILILSLYFFPFFSVNFFQYTHKLSTKVKVPQYVFDYATFSNSSDFNFNRTILIPGNNPENSVHNYEWGYWSLASLQSLLDQKAYISANNGFTFNRKMILDLYATMRENNPVWENIADHLQVDSILVQKDFKPYDYRGIKISADTYIPTIQASSKVKLVKDFGEWQLYSLEKNLSPVAKNYVEVHDQTEQFRITTLLSQLFPQMDVLYSDRALDENIIKKVGYVNIPQCQDCLLQRNQVYFANPNIIVTPGSTLESFQNIFHIFSKGSVVSPPVDTLQTQYIIQASFNRKGESQNRIPFWNLYNKGLKKYEEDVNKILSEFSQTIPQNNQLQGYYNNLLFQLSNLRDISNLINNKDEANLFIESVDKVKELITLIESRIVSTQIVHSNVFLADISSEANFSVYLHQPSLNLFSTERNQKLSISLNDQILSASKVLDLEWIKVGEVMLEKGGHKITVDDIPLDNSTYFTEEYRKTTQLPEGVDVSFGASEPCVVIPIGELTHNHYNLKLEVKSVLGEIEPTFHVVSKDDVSPELPFWGVKQKISDGSWKEIILPFFGSAHENYDLKICDTSTKESVRLAIRNLNLDRSVEPLLALVENKDTIATMSSMPKLELNKSSNTEVDIKIENSASGILRLPIKYNPNWISSNPSLKTTNINGTSVGVYIPDETKNVEFKLTYLYQKYYTIAGTITVAGLISLILYLLINILKKDAKKIK